MEITRKKNIQIEGKHNKPILCDLFFQDDQKPKPVVIFCHGYKGFKDWGAWDKMAEIFAEKGYFFVKFNFSHNGTTPENPTEFLDIEAFGDNNYTIELDDLQSVIDWILLPDFQDNGATKKAVAWYQEDVIVKPSMKWLHLSRHSFRSSKRPSQNEQQ